MADPDLNSTDRLILHELAVENNVPTNLADVADKSRQYVHQRLKLLEAADYVENIGNGVYSLRPGEIPGDVQDDLGIATEEQIAKRLRRERDELRERVEELEAQLDATGSDA